MLDFEFELPKQLARRERRRAHPECILRHVRKQLRQTVARLLKKRDERRIARELLARLLYVGRRLIKARCQRQRGSSHRRGRTGPQDALGMVSDAFTDDCRNFGRRRSCAGGGPAQHLWQLPRRRPRDTQAHIVPPPADQAPARCRCGDDSSNDVRAGLPWARAAPARCATPAVARTARTSSLVAPSPPNASGRRRSDAATSCSRSEPVTAFSQRSSRAGPVASSRSRSTPSGWRVCASASRGLRSNGGSWPGYKMVRVSPLFDEPIWREYTGCAWPLGRRRNMLLLRSGQSRARRYRVLYSNYCDSVGG